MSLVLLAIIGTNAVFAQEPTMDKLAPVNAGSDIKAANTSISGVVVIPYTYNSWTFKIIANRGFQDCTGITSVIIPEGMTTIGISAFQNTGLTSVTIPASVNNLGRDAFKDCSKLTSVTFQGVIRSNTIDSNTFPGDLRAKYVAGGEGTYTRQAGSDTWTKQGGFSLSGVWTRADGMKITITDNGANIVITGDKPDNGGKLNDIYTKK